MLPATDDDAEQQLPPPPTYKSSSFRAASYAKNNDLINTKETVKLLQHDDEESSASEISLSDVPPPVTATATDTYVNVLKCMLGAGWMAFPYATSQCGILLAMLLSMILLFIIMTNAHFLVNAKTALTVRGFPAAALTVYRIAYILSSWLGCLLVILSIIISQFGCCTGYLIFFATAFSTVTNTDYKIWCGVGAVLVLPLSLVPNLKYLVKFSLFGNIILILCISAVVIYCFTLMGNVQSGLSIFNINGAPIYAGVFAFAASPTSWCLPYHENMARKPKFIKILDTVLFGCVMFYMLFGIIGYMVFGNLTKDIFTLNLPYIMQCIVQISIAVVLVIGYPLHMFTISEGMNQLFFSVHIGRSARKGSTDEDSEISGLDAPPPSICQRYEGLFRLLLRVLQVAATMVAAMFIPRFSQVIGFCSGISFVFLNGFFPAFFYLRLYGDGLSRWMIALTVCVGCLGVMFGVIITTFLLKDFIQH